MMMANPATRAIEPRPSNSSLSPDDFASVTAPNSTESRDLEPHGRDKVLRMRHVVSEYLIEDCDWLELGWECAKPEYQSMLKAFALRNQSVLITFAFVILLALLLTQFTIKTATRRVSKSSEWHLQRYEEIVFQQMSCVLVVVAVLELCIGSQWIGSRLENLFFYFFQERFPWIDRNVHIDFVFHFLLVILLTFAFCFLMMACFLALSNKWINCWLRTADVLNPSDAALKTEGRQSHREYLLLRYEFEAGVQKNCVPGLDPPGLYFQNYCRASAYRVATDILDVRISVLILGFIASCILYFVPLRTVLGTQEIALMAWVAGLALLGVGIINVQVWLTKRRLMPRDLCECLKIRCSMSLGAPGDLGSEDGDLCTPRYLLKHHTPNSCLPMRLAKFLYGTKFPNHHEALFLFWKNGPSILVFWLQVCVLIQICVVALTLTFIDAHHQTWLVDNWPWSVVLVLGLCFLQWVQLPFIMWNLAVVTATSGLVDDDLLQAVWETQRSRSIQRFRTLIDTLRIEVNFLKLEAAGPALLDRWSEIASMESNHALVNSAFHQLDPDHRNGLIFSAHVLRYLTGEGLPVSDEVAASRWVKVFDRKGKKGLDRNDFEVLAWNVQDLLSRPLESEQVLYLFGERFDLKADQVIDINGFLGVFKKLGLQWKRHYVAHLLHYLSDARGIERMEVEHFVFSLPSIESNAIGRLRQVAGDLGDDW